MSGLVTRDATHADKVWSMGSWRVAPYAWRAMLDAWVIGAIIGSVARGATRAMGLISQLATCGEMV